MNTIEISAMLEWISRHERFLVVDELTVRAWRDVLKPDIDVHWVKDYLVRYYSKPDQPPMTAGRINEAWYRSRETEVVKKYQQPKAVPMPEWFRDKALSVGKMDDDA